MERENEIVCGLGGMIAGAVTGAINGAHIGIAAGPVGAIAGTIPCAVICVNFYIVTPQFDKFAAYSDDGQCLIFYEK